MSAAPGRALTIGLVLGVSVIALASLAVVTIAPLIPAELGGIERYGWIFSANLLATLLGTVWGGAQADRHGPGRAFGLGLVAFVVASALAALSPTMEVLIAARALQGLGGGAIITSIYVVVSQAYPDAGRARVLALLSSAWVLPALLGPAAAGLIAEATSWRWVFAALVPFSLAVALLTLPSFGGMRRSAAAVAASGVASARERLWSAALLSLAVGVGLWALSADLRPGVSVSVVLAAAALVPRTLGRLLPEGTLRLRPGVGAVIAARGLLFAGFITVEVYLALMLTGVLGLSSALTGLVIATGAVVWTTGSWTQARLDALRSPAHGAGVWARLGWRRELRVRLGVLGLSAGIAVQLLALWLALHGASGVALAVALGGWALAGLGIGFAHASASVAAFERAELEGVEAGSLSSALQLVDGVAAAIATGVAGALLASVALEHGTGAGVAAAYAVGATVTLVSLLAAWRIGAVPPGPTPAAR